MASSKVDALKHMHSRFDPSDLFPDSLLVRNSMHGGPATFISFFIEAVDDELLRPDVDDDDKKRIFQAIVQRWIDCKTSFQRIFKDKIPGWKPGKIKIKWKQHREWFMHDVKLTYFNQMARGVNANVAIPQTSQSGSQLTTDRCTSTISRIQA